nr:site-specific integrase [Vibrio anguillarum]
EIPEHTDKRTGVLIEEKLPLTIFDCTEKVEESPIVRYRDYLLENLYTEDENGKIGGSPNTASSYVLKVVAFYTFLHRQRVVPLSKTFRPFEFSVKKVRISHRNRRAQHDMLSHLNGYHGEDIIVYTTGLTKPFKNIQKPQNADIRELRPLLEDEKQEFYRYLDVENTSDTKALMLYLATEVGLRLEELITFPA